MKKNINLKYVIFCVIVCASYISNGQIQIPGAEKLDGIHIEANIFAKYEHKFNKACKELSTVSSMDLNGTIDHQIKALSKIIVAFRKFENVVHPEALKVYTEFAEKYENETVFRNRYSVQYEFIAENINGMPNEVDKKTATDYLETKYSFIEEPNISRFKSNLNMSAKFKARVVRKMLRSVTTAISIIECQRKRKLIIQDFVALKGVVELVSKLDPGNQQIALAIVELTSRIESFHGRKKHVSKPLIVNNNLVTSPNEN